MSRPPGALEVLDVQVELIRWWRSPAGRRFAREMPVGLDDPDGAAAAHALDLDRAATYSVSAEMTDLTAHAAETMRPQPLKEFDLPSRRGFAFFDRSILGPSCMTGKPVGFRAVAWFPTTVMMDVPGYHDELVPAIGLSFYSDRKDPADHTFDGTFQQLANTFLVPRMFLGSVGAWVYDTGYDEGVPEAHFCGSDLSARRFMAAFWTLVQQKLAWKEHVPLDHGARRRCQRAQVSIDREIKVVSLRKVKDRPRAPGNGHVDVDWTHRWVVDGHWRNQWYPARGVHREKWIETYTKGPDDKPLVIRDTVYRWRR